MSLETKIETLTQAIIALTVKLESGAAPVVNPTLAAPTVAAPAPTTVTVAAASNAVAVSGTPVGMPPPPSFQVPAPVVANVGAPIVEAPNPLVQPVVAQVSVTSQNLAPLQPVAPVMPAPPAFVAPAPVTAPVISNAPFTDGKGLIEYVMNSYKALGPQKGAQIQNILTGLGYQNINDIKPEHYGQLYAGVEALK